MVMELLDRKTDSSTGAPSGTDSAKGRSTDESNGYDESLLSIRAMALVQSSLEKIPHHSLPLCHLSP
jgi:hypothetical protein